MERNVMPEEAAAADEVFLTSSLRDVQGVERWDDRIFPAARPVTQELAFGFRERSATDLNP
jgi:branched-chain amino acid aminotransferase